jgi:serine/threonine protein kinase
MDDVTISQPPIHTGLLLADSLPPVIGKYTLKQRLGAGGFGVVYLAVDTVLNRLVALKLPRPELVTHPDIRERFLSEARACALLDHPNILRIHEAGEIDEFCYISMAYSAGPSLARWLTQHPKKMPPELAARIVRDLALAVEYSHRQGIVHRDIKPSNILLSAVDQPEEHEFPFTPRISDFGHASTLGETLTMSGTSIIAGTFGYMSPEQAEGRSGSKKASVDIYALGATLYELLTGVPPCEAKSMFEYLTHVQSVEPASPQKKRAEIPNALALICQRCLRREPSQRYASAKDLADDLRRFLQGELVHAKPLRIMDRVKDWLTRPERMQETGIFTVILNVSLVLWMMISLPVIIAHGPPGIYKMAVMADSFVTLTSHIPMVICGIGTFRQRRPYILVGLIISGVLLFIGVGTLFGLPGPFDGFYRNPEVIGGLLSLSGVFNLLSVLFGIQFIAYLASWFAWQRWQRAV